MYSPLNLVHQSGIISFPGELIFGLAPLMYAIWDNSDELLSYLSERGSVIASYITQNIFAEEQNQSQNEVTSFKFVILRYYWISLALQVHFFHILFVNQLRNVLMTVSSKVGN